VTIQVFDEETVQEVRESEVFFWVSIAIAVVAIGGAVL
jgi:hypothetical protein